jgi:hypothetical protein
MLLQSDRISVVHETHLEEKSIGFIGNMQQRNPQGGDVWKSPNYRPPILNPATFKFLTIVSHK